MTEYNLCLIQGSDEVCTLVSADTLSYTLENLNPKIQYESVLLMHLEKDLIQVDFTTGNFLNSHCF